jgi:hypothetical protein
MERRHFMPRCPSSPPFRPLMSNDGQPILAFFPEKAGCEQY